MELRIKFEVPDNALREAGVNPADDDAVKAVARRRISDAAEGRVRPEDIRVKIAR